MFYPCELFRREAKLSCLINSELGNLCSVVLLLEFVSSGSNAIDVVPREALIIRLHSHCGTGRGVIIGLGFEQLLISFSSV